MNTVGGFLVLILATLFLIPMSMFVFSTIQQVRDSQKRIEEIHSVANDVLIARITRTTANETLKAAVAEAGFYIGWDDHWPSWGFGINAPGDPGHLLWEFKAAPKKLCADTPGLEAECMKRFIMTVNRLEGRRVAADQKEYAALERALWAFSEATGIEVIEMRERGTEG